MDKDGPETMREAVARAIAKGLGDEFDNAFVSKVGWTAAQGQRGGRFRDINEPFQADYLDAADAAIRTVLERLREPSEAVWTAGRDPILARESRMPASMLVEQTWYDAERDCAGRKDGYITKGDCAVWVWRAMLDAAAREVG